MNRVITIVELDMPKCSRQYGVYPCEATGAAADSCFNTRASCQFPSAFDGTITQTYRFSDTNIGVPPDIEAIPCISAIPDIAPAKLTPLQGLGARASVSVKFNDFAYHDRGLDPYVASRTYTPEDQGTFWGKFRARHQYYQGRKMRVRVGNIQTPWDWGTFSDRTYILDRIVGPDKNGQVTITGKDILKLTDGDKARCPIASSSTLTDNITDSALSLVLSPAGIGNSEYEPNEQTYGEGYIRIGSEIMAYTRSGDDMTITRAAWGTTAASHTAGDSIQLCASWEGVNAVAVIKEILGPLYADVDYANSGTSYLSDSSWDDEPLGSASPYLVTAIISKPEGADKLINELCDQCLLMLWWDEVNQLIIPKSIAPELTVNELTDDTELVMGSIDVSDDPTKRISQVWFYYGQRDPTAQDKAENYRYLYIQPDLEAEGVDEYGEQKIKTVMSRWLTTSGPVIKTAYRSLIFLRDNPRTVKFSLDSKDRDNDIGQSVLFTSRFIQDSKGAPLPIGLLITSMAEKSNSVEYSAIAMGFYGRYLRIAPGGDNSSGTHVPSTYSATIADYSTATDEEKKKYGYIIAGGSNASGTHVPVSNSAVFSDGGLPYKIA